MTIGQPKKIKYLTNKDLLAEIHRSKSTFCSFTDDSYAQYDIILPSLDKINIRTIAEAKRNRAARLSKLAHAEAVEAAGKKIPAKQFDIDYRKMEKQDLIFRIMTFEHIPEDLTRKKTKKTVADHHTKVNFPPFQHWKFDEKDNLICVGKSHWEGGMENGFFNPKAGKATNKLALMWM